MGFGGAEELFEAQVWVNYDMIRMQDMLDAASKTILKAVGPNSGAIAAKNNLKDLDNLSIIDAGEGGDIGVADTFPRNLQLFENSITNWTNHAKEMGAAQDPLQGKEPSAGTPFASLQAQIQQGLGLHEYRRQQFARHIEEIYTDWIIPHIQKKICEGAEFLSELSLDELQAVGERMAESLTNERVKKVILDGGTVTEEQRQTLRQLTLEQFKKKGNKHFIQILKGEFAKTPLKVKVSVAGKSKNLAQMTDKVTNIFRFVFSNPQGFAQIMQLPGMAKAFSEILEYSGLSPVDFQGIEKMALPQPTQMPITEEPALAQ